MISFLVGSRRGMSLYKRFYSEEIFLDKYVWVYTRNDDYKKGNISYTI